MSKRVEEKAFVPFLSLRSLQDSYRELRRRRQSEESQPQFWNEVETFLQRGEAVGAYLDNDDERQTAQSRLDYWHLELLKIGLPAPEAVLVPFNVELQPEIPDERCPYVGLGPFTEDDHHLFFGRKQLTDQLLKTLTLSRLITVVGSSGSGKSSLVLAGLLPRLRHGALANSENWRIYGPIVPGSAPLSNLAQMLQPDEAPTASWMPAQTAAFLRNDAHLAELMVAGGEETAVLLIDQFEETFTLCRDLVERQAFIDNLLQLVRTRSGNHIVIITMRSDYESYINKVPLFQSLYEPGTVRVNAMKAGEMREAIEEPAKQVGLRFEDGLVEEILREIVGEPAVLPLLQFALMQLWENRERNYITWETYRRLGSSVLQSLETTAETLYKSLPVEEQETARRILLRLVWPTEGVETTRNRVRRNTLYLSGEANDRVDRVLDKLIDARLVHLTRGLRTQDDQVEVAHEALVRNWRRLIGWLEDERSQLRQRQRLSLEARKWDTLQKDPGALLRGTLLREALTYEDLNELETEFVQTSLNVLEQERQAVERQQQEIIRRRTRSIILLIITTVIALIAAFIALSSSQVASQQATEADVARAAARADAALLATAQVEVSEQRDVAEANALAAQEARATAEANEAIAVQNQLAANAARATAETSALALQQALQETENSAREAEAARAAAEQQSRLAVARELAAIANDQLASDPQLGLLLAIEAVNLVAEEADTVPAEAEETLYRALQTSQLEATFSGHTDGLTAVSFSPDGTQIATASRDTTVKIWETATGQEVMTLTDHGRVVNDVVFSPNGRFLASGSDDGLTIIWNLQTGQRQRVLGGSGSPILALAFSPDSSRLVTTSSDRSIRVWDVAASKSIFHTFVHTAAVTAVAFDASGTRFATVGSDGRILLWNTELGTVALALRRQTDGENNPIRLTSVAFSPDSNELLVADERGQAQVWDLINGRLRFTLAGHVSAINSVAYSSDGQLLATASDDRTVKVWDATTGQARYTLSGHQGGITAVAFAPNGEHIATASQDSTARLWQTQPGIQNLILTGNDGPLFSAAFSPDGRFVVTGGSDKKAKVWELATGQVVAEFADHNQAVIDVAYSPNGRFIATGSEDWVIRLWNLDTGLVEIPTLNHRGPVTSLVFNGDGSQLASGSEDGFARIWRLPARSISADIWLRNETAVNSVAFSPDGTLLAAGLADGDVAIWDIETEQVVATYHDHNGPINSVAFHPDGTLLVSASNDGTAKVWNTATGEVLRTFSGHSGAVLSVAFSPDGSQIATASVDRTVKVWETATGQTVRTLLGHTSTVYSARFSPDGSQLVTASFDRTADVTALTPVLTLFEQALAQAKRPLTATECAQYLHGLPCRLSSND